MNKSWFILFLVAAGITPARCIYGLIELSFCGTGVEACISAVGVMRSPKAKCLIKYIFCQIGFRILFFRPKKSKCLLLFFLYNTQIFLMKQEILNRIQYTNMDSTYQHLCIASRR